MEVKIKTNIAIKDLIVYTRKEKELGYYAAYLPQLDLYGIGNTEKKAIKDLTQVLNLTIDSCIEKGTLETVLEQAGFTKRVGSTVLKPKSAPRNIINTATPVPIDYHHAGLREACA